MNEPTATKSIRTKTFRFTTELEWDRGKSGRLTSAQRPEMRITSPPEFRGETDSWTPEHMFVAAADTCLMLTFASYVEKEGLQLDSYHSDAQGTLEWIDGGFRFTSVTLRPHITVPDHGDIAAAERLLARAHEACLIARSINAHVTLSSSIVARHSDGHGS